jgi:hypothetical protein
VPLIGLDSLLLPWCEFMNNPDLNTVLHAPEEATRSRGERTPTISDVQFYESSNGDMWGLTRDPISGARAVMHRPNVQSGGRVSYIDVDKFLREGANGPEHQALRLLLQR